MRPATLPPLRPPAGNQSAGRNTGEAIMLEVDERREIVSRESTLASAEKSEGANRDLAPSTAPASGPVAPPARGCFATSNLNDLYRRPLELHQPHRGHPRGRCVQAVYLDQARVARRIGATTSLVVPAMRAGKGKH